MSNLKKILSSFHIKDELNPKIWKTSENDEISMNPKVRTHLLEIAYDFIESLDVDIIISDIIMTGSLANYNWSNYSDVDIHIIADFQQFPENTRELYSELFHLKKTLYGLKHNITIFGYDVELYIEDGSIKKEVQSAGRYSILMDEWVVKPSKESIDINISEIREKSQKWMKIIDGIEEIIQDEDIETAKKLIKKYTTKIRKFRECGLEKGGEYSDENLVFKILRRNGYLEKIREMKDKLIDKKLSLKEAMTNIGGEFKTDLENGPENHGKRPLGNWQSDNAWDVFAPAGTMVKSYTNGTVKKVYDTGKSSGKIFGTQVTIQGTDGHPDIFYTHLKNVNLQPGQTISIGDNIGEISEWEGKDNMTHVHIGLPEGHTLKELLTNSSEIFNNNLSEPVKDVNIEDSIESMIEKNPKYKDKNIDEILKTSNESTFLKKLLSVISLDKTFKNLKSSGSKIPYDSSVEVIQTALQFLGFSLPKWGVDGLFGPETESAVKMFESKNGLTEDGILSSDDLKQLYSILAIEGFKDSDLSKIQKVSDFDSIDIGDDKVFYTEILKGIGAPITDENLKYLYAWRQAEGGKATNNPFNTTLNLKSDVGMSNYNNAKVRNYSTSNHGLEATVKTLLLPNYTCIVNGLRNDIGADEISKCSSLKTWGTGDLVSKVIQSGNINPPKIYSA